MNYTVRIVNIACPDNLGQQKRTFTKDEKGNINSPSFESYYDFLMWVKQPYLYPFRADMNETKKNYKAPFN